MAASSLCTCTRHKRECFNDSKIVTTCSQTQREDAHGAHNSNARVDIAKLRDGIAGARLAVTEGAP